MVVFTLFLLLMSWFALWILLCYFCILTPSPLISRLLVCLFVFLASELPLSSDPEILLCNMPQCCALVVCLFTLSITAANILSDLVDHWFSKKKKALNLCQMFFSCIPIDTVTASGSSGTYSCFLCLFKNFYDRVFSPNSLALILSAQSFLIVQ